MGKFSQVVHQYHFNNNIYSATEQKKRKRFGWFIEGGWVTSVNPPPNSSDTKNETNSEEYSDDNEEAQVIADIKDSV